MLNQNDGNDNEKTYSLVDGRFSYRYHLICLLNSDNLNYLYLHQPSLLTGHVIGEASAIYGTVRQLSKRCDGNDIKQWDLTLEASYKNTCRSLLQN